MERGNPDNFVGYRVTEKLVANVAQSTATGRTNNVTATMTINGTTVSNVTVTADLATSAPTTASAMAGSATPVSNRTGSPRPSS